MVAILTSVLTLALFIKFFGALFLSRPSAVVLAQTQRRGALEVAWKMRAAQAALAALCLVLGLAPVVPMMLLGRAIQASQQGLGALLANTQTAGLGWAGGLAGVDAASVYNPLMLAALLGLLLLLARAIARYGEFKRRLRRLPGWSGEPAPAPAPAPAPPAAKPKEALSWSFEKN